MSWGIGRRNKTIFVEVVHSVITEAAGFQGIKTLYVGIGDMSLRCKVIFGISCPPVLNWRNEACCWR